MLEVKCWKTAGIFGKVGSPERKKGRHTWDWEGWNTGNCAITEVDLTGIIIVKEWST